eukprot:TRINITY_DN2452_c0_g1_i1.p1 TRINITY_DN2452_c0_g1~~TRINITY_DN2452_c0_g1_i1.p1  ORF type:complete len:2399 (-),score=311.52 TRINITY_DN2452_c0_g1_i1:95-6610(-)
MIGSAAIAAAYAFFQPYYMLMINRLHCAVFLTISWLSVAICATAGHSGRAAVEGCAPIVAIIGFFLPLARTTYRPALASDGSGQAVRWFPHGLDRVQEHTPRQHDGEDSYSPEMHQASDLNPRNFMIRSLSHILVGSDVEVAIRYLNEPSAKVLHRQGRTNLTTDRRLKILCALAGTYFTRGEQRFPDSALLRLQYAQYLILWANAYDIAAQNLQQLLVDASTPFDIRFLAMREQQSLRTQMDLDSATASVMKKAKHRHRKALVHVHGLLREALARGPSGAVSALSHHAHQLAVERHRARLLYQDGLSHATRSRASGARKPNRQELKYWAMFLDHVMMDHNVARQAYEYIERQEQQSVSQRSHHTASTSESGSTQSIPGLLGTPGADSEGTGDAMDVRASLGMALLLRKTVRIAFSMLGIICASVFVFSLITNERTSKSFDNMHDASRLQSLIFQATLRCYELDTSANNSTLATLRNLGNQVNEIQLDFITRRFSSDFAELRQYHSSPVVPLLEDSGSGPVLHLSPIWVFGDLVISKIKNILELPQSEAWKRELRFMMLNSPAIGAAYNHSLWLYSLAIPNLGESFLQGQAMLLLGVILALAATALLFLWSFTHIAQQRYVVLRFISMLPPAVLRELANTAQQNLDEFDHPDNGNETDGEWQGEDELQALPTDSLSVLDPANNRASGPQAEKEKHVAHAVRRFPESKYEGLRRRSSQSNPGVLSDPGEIDSPHSLECVSPPPEALFIKLPRIYSSVSSDTPGEVTAEKPRDPPRVHVVPPVMSPIRRSHHVVVQRHSQPTLARKPSERRLNPVPSPTSSVSGTRRDNTPYGVFFTAAALFILVCGAVFVLVTQLSELSNLDEVARKETDTYWHIAQAFTFRSQMWQLVTAFAQSADLRWYILYREIAYELQSNLLDVLRHDSSPETSRLYHEALQAATPLGQLEKKVAAITVACNNLEFETVPELLSVLPSKNTSGQTNLNCSFPLSALAQSQFQDTLDAVISGLFQAAESSQSQAITKVDAAKARAMMLCEILVSVYATMLGLFLFLILRLRQSLQFWRIRSLRLMLLLCSAGVISVLGVSFGSIGAISTSANSLRKAIDVTKFRLEEESVEADIVQHALNFAQRGSAEAYQSYIVATTQQAASKALLNNFGAQHVSNLVAAQSAQRRLEKIALFISGKGHNYLVNMPEVADLTYARLDSDLMSTPFVSREHDIALSAKDQVRVALRLLTCEQYYSQWLVLRSTLSTVETSLQQEIQALMDNTLQLRQRITWATLALSLGFAMGVVVLSLLLALKALEFYGNQAISKLNDATINNYVRTYQTALAIIAIAFCGTILFFMIHGSSTYDTAKEVVLASEREGTTGMCAVLANQIVNSPEGFSDASIDRLQLRDCVTRMNAVRLQLFDSRHSVSEVDLDSTLPLSGNSTGLYLYYTLFISAANQLIALPATATPQELRKILNKLLSFYQNLLPLFHLSLTEFDGLTRKTLSDQRAIYYALCLFILVLLLAVFVFALRPMVQQLLEEQAVMRSLLLLIPEEHRTSDMEEFLEKGAVQNTEHLLAREDTEIGGSGNGDDAMFGDDARIENEAEELRFLDTELEQWTRSSRRCLLCSPEGVVLWANPAAAVALSPSNTESIVGEHLSTLLPYHARAVLMHPPTGQIESIGGNNLSAPLEKVTRSGSANNQHGALVVNTASQPVRPVTLADRRQVFATEITEHFNPSTAARYIGCFLCPLENAPLASFLSAVGKGTDPLSAASGLDDCTVSAVVTSSNGSIVAANRRAEGTLGVSISELRGQSALTLLVEPQIIQDRSGTGKPFTLGGFDIFVKTKAQPAVPFFLNIAQSGGAETFYVLCFYPLGSPSAGVTAGQLPVANLQKKLRKAKHTDLQAKKCTILEIEFGLSPSCAAAAAMQRSQQALETIHAAAQQHRGALHWAVGDCVALTFNHSSANGSHILSACNAATDLLKNIPTSRLGHNASPSNQSLANNTASKIAETSCPPTASNVRIAIATSPALCGFYGRLPLLHGDLTDTAAVLLRVTRDMPLQCVVDRSVWQTAQFSFSGRPVNTVTMQVPGETAQSYSIYELTGTKNQAADEWMYQLASYESPFQKYEAAWDLFVSGQRELALESLSEYVSEHPDDAVAQWLLTATHDTDRREWAGRTSYSLGFRASK